MSISVVILSKNEADNIAELIPSLNWADEIIVIDDNSEDETVEVAEKLGARVFKRSLNNDYASQRNYGLKKSGSEWVLFLDADERLGEKSVEKIQELVLNSEKDGYFLKREDVLFDKRLKHGETGNMWLLRLGKRDAGVWDREVHEVWQIENVEKADIIIDHYAHETLHEFVQAVRRYAKIEAKKRLREGKQWNFWEMLFFPLGKFFYTFFYQKGFLDGFRGFLVSAVMSYHSFLVRWNMLRSSFKLHKEWDVLRILVLALLFMLPFGQVWRVQVTPNVGFYLFEPLLAVILLVWSGQIWKEKSGKLPPFALPYSVFTGVLLLSLLANLPWLKEIAVRAGLYWVRWVVYGGVWIVLVDLVRQKRLELSSSNISVLTLAWAMVGLLQYVLMPDLRWLWWFGWDEHYYRLVGSLLDPAFTAVLLSSGLVVILKKAEEKHFFWWGEIGIVLLALVLTFSRSGWMALAVGLFYLSIRKGWWKQILIGMTVFSLLLFLVPKPGGEGVNIWRTFSIVSRIESVEEGLQLFYERPLLGAGYNAFPWLLESERSEVLATLPSHQSGPDNSFVLILATAGILGGGALLWLWWRLFAFFRGSEHLQAAFLVILAHSMTNNTWFYPFVMIWMGLLLAAKSQEKKV